MAFYRGCWISEITQTDPDETFKLKKRVRNIDYYDTFYLSESNVPVWRTNICKQLRNVEVLWLIDAKISEIHKEAFDGCTKVRELNISMNTIQHLEAGVFDGLTNLKSLDLANNKLTVFHPKFVENLKSLSLLDLSSNHLFIINAKFVEQSIPNLSSFGLSDNNILCSRMGEIKNELQGVKFITVEPEHKRNRSYEPLNVDGMFCLSDTQFNDELSEIFNT